MCSCSLVGQQISRSEPLRFSFLQPNNPPNSISFRIRIRPGPSLRSKLNDAVFDSPAAKSFYELLGIPETGSLLEIKQAYKQLARKYHPDVSPPGRVEEYTQRFIRVQEAYETLSDPRRRELYDTHMAKGIHLAFTARRRRTKYQDVEEEEEMEMEGKTEWKKRWEGQVSELKRRSMEKESPHNMSWAARIRRQTNQPF